MEKWEMLVYVVFVVLTISGVVMIYFYLNRHSHLTISDDSKRFASSGNDDEIEFEKNKEFDWDLPSDEIANEEKKFLGTDVWENQELANERIESLRFQLNSSSLIKLNMFETYLISKQYGKYIRLEMPGIFQISKGYLEIFLNELVFDIAMIKEVDEFIDKNTTGGKKIEIEAKKLFYVMRNATNLGIKNLKSDVQLFEFTSSVSNEVIDIENDSDEENFITFEVMDLLEEDTVIVSEKEEFAKQEELKIEQIKKFKEATEATVDENGFTTLKLNDNISLVKSSPWKIEKVINKEEEEEAREKQIEEEAKKQKNKNIASVIKEDSNNINPSKQDVSQKKDKRIGFLKRFDTHGKNLFLEFNNNKEVNFIGSLRINDNDELLKKNFESLSDTNFMKIIAALLDSNYSNFKIDFQEKNYSFNYLVREGNQYFISYEYLLYFLLSLLDDYENYCTSTNMFRRPPSLNFKFGVAIVNIFAEEVSKRFRIVD